MLKNALFYFYFFNFLFFSLVFRERTLKATLSFSNKTPSFIRQRNNEIDKIWKNSELTNFLSKTTTSFSTKRLRVLKEQLKKLGLIHLLTPSGIHLAPLKSLLRMTFLMRFFSFVFMGIFFLPHLFSLKRIVLLHFLPRGISPLIGLFFVFIGDVIRGGFQASPLSFCFSLLFLGILFFRPPRMWLHFFMGQIMINYFFQTSISPIAFLLSPLLTFIFVCFFPFLLLTYFLPLFSLQLQMAKYLVEVFLVIVQKASLVVGFFPLIQVNMFLLVGFGLFLFGKRKWAIGLILLSVHDVNFQKRKHIPLKLPQRIYSPRGIHKCRHQLKNEIWIIKCRK